MTWKALLGLTIKGAAVIDARTGAAQRHGQRARDVRQDRPDRFLNMDMLMRIQVRGLATDHFTKCVQLTLDLSLHVVGVMERHVGIDSTPLTIAISQLAEINVQAD